MADKKVSGYDIDSAKKLILMIIENHPGIRPSILETHLVRGKVRSDPGMSRSMLYRALDSLRKEGLIEYDQESGRKERAYYLKGRRPTIVKGPEPSQFDEFVIQECRKVISSMIDRQLLSPDSETTEYTKGKQPFEIEPRVLNTFKLVETWESMRGFRISRTWGSNIQEFTFGMSVMGVKNPKFIITYKVDEPTMHEWFYFYTNAIDQISRYCQTHTGKTKSK